MRFKEKLGLGVKYFLEVYADFFSKHLLSINVRRNPRNPESQPKHRYCQYRGAYFIYLHVWI